MSNVYRRTNVTHRVVEVVYKASTKRAKRGCRTRLVTSGYAAISVESD